MKTSQIIKKCKDEIKDVEGDYGFSRILYHNTKSRRPNNKRTFSDVEILHEFASQVKGLVLRIIRANNAQNEEKHNQWIAYAFSNCFDFTSPFHITAFINVCDKYLNELGINSELHHLVSFPKSFYENDATAILSFLVEQSIQNLDEVGKIKAIKTRIAQKGANKGQANVQRDKTALIKVVKPLARGICSQAKDGMTRKELALRVYEALDENVKTSKRLIRENGDPVKSINRLLKELGYVAKNSGIKAISGNKKVMKPLKTPL